MEKQEEVIHSSENNKSEMEQQKEAYKSMIDQLQNRRNEMEEKMKTENPFKNMMSASQSLVKQKVNSDSINNNNEEEYDGISLDLSQEQIINNILSSGRKEIKPVELSFGAKAAIFMKKYWLDLMLVGVTGFGFYYGYKYFFSSVEKEEEFINAEE